MVLKEVPTNIRGGQVLDAQTIVDIAETAIDAYNVPIKVKLEDSDDGRAKVEKVGDTVVFYNLKGAKGDKGEKGNDLTATPIKGNYLFNVRSDGHLVLIYDENSATAPKFRIENGRLVHEIQ